MILIVVRRLDGGKLNATINADTDFLTIFRKYDGIRYDLNIIDLMACAYKQLRRFRTAIRWMCGKN